MTTTDEMLYKQRAYAAEDALKRVTAENSLLCDAIYDLLGKPHAKRILEIQELLTASDGHAPEEK